MQTATSDIRTNIVVKCQATGEVVGRGGGDVRRRRWRRWRLRLGEAQPAWQRLGVEGRAKWLGKWRDWLLDRGDQLHTLVPFEGAVSPGLIRHSEMLLRATGRQLLDRQRHTQFLADQYGDARREPRMGAKKLTVVYEP